MGKYVLGWFMGVPVIVLVIIYFLFNWRHHVKNNGFVSEKAEPVINRVAAVAHKAVDKAADAATPTVDWLAERGESLNATQKKLAADACSYVSAHPLKAVGIAAVAGFLLSRVLL